MLTKCKRIKADRLRGLAGKRQVMAVLLAFMLLGIGAGCLGSNPIAGPVERFNTPTAITQTLTPGKTETDVNSTIVTPNTTETKTSTEAMTPTKTATATETAIPTETEKAPASTEWQLSPDGHIYYKESELYGGMFTINKEHPEWVEKYWEDTIRGLWNLNYVSENKSFIDQFPTDDALIDYLNNGGGPVGNLWIPVIYPDASRRFVYKSTMVPTSVKINLSRIAIEIYKPTREEIYDYNPSYASGTKYVSYQGASGEFRIEETSVGNTNILDFSFRKDLLFDSKGKIYVDDVNGNFNQKDFTFLSLSDEKNPEDNLLAATQLIRMLGRRMQYDRFNVDLSLNPILIAMNATPSYRDCVEITNFDGSPIALR